jgi:hypothetical protein
LEDITMKTPIFAIILLLLALTACSGNNTGPLTGSSQSSQVYIASFPATGPSITSAVTGIGANADLLFITPTNASEKNFSVTIWGVNSTTNTSVQETISVNGSLNAVTANKFSTITKVLANATTTQGFKVSENYTRDHTIVTFGATDLLAFGGAVLDGTQFNNPGNGTQVCTNTSSQGGLSQFTETGFYIRCSLTGAAINITPYVSPNGQDWFSTGLVSCNGNTTYTSGASFLGTRFLQWQVCVTDTNNTRVLAAASAK